jgi:flagellar hook-associated protein 3 FlgL
MRVTNNSLINKFSSSLNTSLTNLNKISEQVSTGMKFQKASEDTAAAIKAFKVRRSITRVQQYQENIKEAQGQLDQTESTLMGIKELVMQAKESLIQGSTGTMSEENKKTVADIFNSLKDQLFKLANTNYAGKFILGGTNTTQAPFTVSDGKLFYNGQDLNSESITSDDIYIDVGLGLKVDGTGNVNTDTAFSISTSGSKVLGYGIDADGLPNNLYNLFSDIAKSLEDNDMSKVEKQVNKLSEKADDILVQIANIGERCKFVDFLSERASTDELNLQIKQNDIEAIDRAAAITQYKSTEMTYLAALQMGSKIIESSLFDFLR